MDTKEYFASLSKGYEIAQNRAQLARSKGFDPETFVEIKIAPDIASRVEGIIGIPGIAEIIKSKERHQSKSELAFEVVKEICTNEKFGNYETVKRLELAVRVGLALQTDGVLVAPTEGVYGITQYKNPDGTEYLAMVFTGPIRSAGGTSVALSVAFADYARRIFNLGAYQPTQEEIERYVEEVEIYNARAVRLQYKPSDDDLRAIVKSCPICVDSLPTEEIEVSVHRDMKKIGLDGKEVRVSNRVRGGIPLVLCEGIAQKAKKVLKEIKNVGLDWSWLNNVIKVEKTDKSQKVEQKDGARSFLDELVAGRPILSYPGAIGGFRLRYGRTRFTGIAAMGVSPATMILTMGFMATGTQLKMESPRKGCVVTPVDSIEGPFIRLKSGESMRVNDAETANRVKDQLDEILSVGDILITFGDFRNANAMLMPSSYVEEFWEAQLLDKDKGASFDQAKMDFKTAYTISLKHDIPIHPKFLLEFQALNSNELLGIAKEVVSNGVVTNSDGTLFGVEKLSLENKAATKGGLEVLTVPHTLENERIIISRDNAQSLLASLGFASGAEGALDISERALEKYKGLEEKESIELIGAVAPFRVMKRSTFIAARIGRPEKAKERMMKPAPNALFPIGDFGGKERNITKAYLNDPNKFGNRKFVANIARYTCPNCKRMIETPKCYDCDVNAVVLRVCDKDNTITKDKMCPICGTETRACEEREIDVAKLISSATKKLRISKMPDTVKGVKGLMSKDKKVEAIEKGILRSLNGLWVFKDGTIRFDATDVPITHFYPKEMNVSVEKLRELGYDKDYYGNELRDENQLVEMKHQDVILSKNGGAYMLKTTHFIDDLLTKFYGVDAFYNAFTANDLIGHMVISLSPHTSCGVLGRVIGFTDANVGFAHPYTICARRRNCDGDEDTTMLLLDGLINFSRSYLPTNIGATMDAPIILSPNVFPEEVDEEVHVMEVGTEFSLDFFNKTLARASPSEAIVETIKERLQKGEERFMNLRFTHLSSQNTIAVSPKRSLYAILNNMQSKIDAEFKLMNMIRAVDKRDAAKRLIISHFIPDLIGNLHTFSRQGFRCVVCNAKYRRMPLQGVCTKCKGKLLLTVSKGGIEKYLEIATNLGDTYSLEPYIRQRIKLIREEINNLFGEEVVLDTKQFNLSKFM
ncbi:MAG: DNA polymerase II large subunit [Candidatus Micrarchaeota archaeon]|nr:DNA polymerase II large subunit [Candidatus Micrarchaeota archaeon]